MVLGAPLRLEMIRSFEGGFAVRYSVDGHPEKVEGGRELQRAPRIHGPWDAVDDLENEYRGVGAGYTASQTSCKGEIWFAPALDPLAERLTFSGLNSGTALFSATVILDHPAVLSREGPRPAS